jgi:hypothetical protein
MVIGVEISRTPNVLRIGGFLQFHVQYFNSLGSNSIRDYVSHQKINVVIRSIGRIVFNLRAGITGHQCAPDRGLVSFHDLFQLNALALKG